MAAALRSFYAASTQTIHAYGDEERLHRHAGAYVAFVLEGGYEETSVDGTIAASCGDMVFHPPYHAHCNVFASDGARVLNIVLPAVDATALGYIVVRSAAFDAIETIARRDARRGAMSAIEEAAASPAAALNDGWIERVAQILRREPSTKAYAAARAEGVSNTRLSRAFTRRFGAGPAAFRAEFRFRTAFNLLLKGWRLADVATTAGYADQSHLTRECRRITGLTPAAIRKSVQDKARFRR